MAIKNLKEKLAKNLIAPSAEDIAAEKWRSENLHWLGKSGDIAMSVMDALDAYGWSQKQLAEKLGVSPQQVNKIVKGHENLKLSTISKLEEVLGINLIEIADCTIQSEPMTSDNYHQSFDLDIDLWIQSLAEIKVEIGSPEFYQTCVEEVISDYSKSKKDKKPAKQTISEIAGENNYALAA
jgi:transcriptional regulator with XRE-family HTH domain